MVKSLKWDCVGHSPLNQTFRDLAILLTRNCGKFVRIPHRTPKKTGI